jgi:outer membrane translocation and assembly module TamA
MQIMRWQLRLGLMILGAGSWIAFLPALDAQCPRGSEGSLIMQRAKTPLPEEVRNRQGETEEEAPARKVHIEDVIVDGTPGQEESIRARILRWLPEDGYDSDSDWIDWVKENAQAVLQENGFSEAKVTTQARVLGGDAAEEQVSVYCQVREGPQYRLANIQFTGAHAFSPSELRSRFPLSDGDLFDISKVREGLEALTRLYGSRGYINTTATPDLRPLRDRQLMSVVFNVEEGSQFRVGSVEVVGFDRQISSLKIMLKVGDVFNANFLDDFFQDNKALLPAGVSPRENVQVKQHLGDATVAVVFDLRPCLQPSGQ